MKEFVMFLDESGDHNLIKIDKQFPVFTLAGCIFEVNYYEKKAVPLINDLKHNHFKNKGIILHSYEIRKAKNNFNVLLNKDKRTLFINDMNKLMGSLKFTIIASCINKESLNNFYTSPGNPYNLAFSFIIERFVKFLKENNGIGYFSIESRDQKSNRDVLEIYDWYRTMGSSYCSIKEFDKRIQKIEFVQKTENINGHQVADLVAYPIGRFSINNKKDNPAFDIIKPKFRKIGTRIKGYGYKVFP